MESVRNTLAIPVGVAIIVASYYLGILIAENLWFTHKALQVILGALGCFIAANVGLFSMFEIWDRWSGNAFEEEYDEDGR